MRAWWEPASPPRTFAMRQSPNLCPRFQAAVEILGKRWTGHILRALMDGPQRFSALAEALTVVSDRTLSERLKELEAGGIVERRVSARPPVRVEYELTGKGRALSEVIGAIGRWADVWIAPESLDSAPPAVAAPPTGTRAPRRRRAPRAG